MKETKNLTHFINNVLGNKVSTSGRQCLQFLILHTHQKHFMACRNVTLFYIFHPTGAQHFTQDFNVFLLSLWASFRHENHLRTSERISEILLRCVGATSLQHDL